MTARWISLATAVVVLTSCDLRPPGPTEVRIEIDLSPLALQVDAAQQTCTSVIEEAVLLINGRDRQRQPITFQTGSIIFEDVEVEVGSVTFEVEVRSGSGVVLYSGRATQLVEEDQFSVTIDLATRNAVLLVCPDEVIIGDSVGYLAFWNIGNAATPVRIIGPPDVCGEIRCLTIEPIEFELAAGEDAEAWMLDHSPQPRAYSVDIESDVGNLTVPVRHPQF